MKMLGDMPMLHGQDDFDQPGNAGRGFCMSNIRFYGTDNQRAIFRTVLSISFFQRLYFYGVS